MTKVCSHGFLVASPPLGRNATYYNMSKATDPSIAEEANYSAENVSMDDLIAQRTRLHSGELEPEPAEEQEEPEAEAEVDIESEEPIEESEEDIEAEEEESEESESDEEEVESESEFDIEAFVENATPEQIQEAASKANSRLLSRIGKLTERAKAAEDEAARLKAAGPAPASLNSDIPEPIRKFDSQEKIEQAMESYERTLEITRKVLREKSDYDADDVVYEADGQEYTKAQLEAAEQGAINALSKHLPRQAKHLEDVAKYKQTNVMWVEQAKKEVPEIQDEESEIGKAYAQLLSNPNVARLKELSPELTVDLEYMFAHAVNSIKGTRKPKVQTGAGKKLKSKPTASPVGSGAARGGKVTKGRAASKYDQWAESGSPDDWVAARIARASKG